MVSDDNVASCVVELSSGVDVDSSTVEDDETVVGTVSTFVFNVESSEDVSGSTVVICSVVTDVSVVSVGTDEDVVAGKVVSVSPVKQSYWFSGTHLDTFFENKVLFGQKISV